MTVTLRPYQRQLVEGVQQAWADGFKNVLGVMPCRSGKTVAFTSLSLNDPDPSCAVVHRQELIGQISTTHARLQIPHNIIAPQPVINFCVEQQIKLTGRSYYDPKAPAAVAGVDTLIRRFDETDRWCRTVKRSTTDEAHHVREENKWGKGLKLFTNARGLGVTATPIRGDGKSLHAEQGGLFHKLVQGVEMRELIDGEYAGNVCDYRVIAPEPSIREAELKIGTTGDYTDNSIKTAAHKSEIIGDAVETYMTATVHGEPVRGKSAIAFTVDVKQAEELAEKFRQAGIPALALDGTTKDKIRQKAMDDFQSGRIKVLTNCELFSEGLDLPGVDVCIMARPTMSFGMFVQQFCRPLTPSQGKRFGIIIDHVGNVLRMAEKYGMPDTPRRWQLWRDENMNRSSKEPDAVPVRACEVCTLTFPSLTMTCPYCGHVHLPADRGAPEQVAGILTEMSPELLERLRMAKAEIWNDRPAIRHGASDGEIGKRLGDHARRQMAQLQLIEAMEFFGGVMLANGMSDSQMQAKFYHTFGVDVMTAQGLPAAGAIDLHEKIQKYLS